MDDSIRASCENFLRPAPEKQRMMRRAGDSPTGYGVVRRVQVTRRVDLRHGMGDAGNIICVARRYARFKHSRMGMA